jgi:probable HAF family extracellular repeat protein
MTRFRSRSAAASMATAGLILLAGLSNQAPHAQSAPYALSDLGTLGGLTAQAQDINEAGQVVGYSTTSTNQGRAFLWQDGP